MVSMVSDDDVPTSPSSTLFSSPTASTCLQFGHDAQLCGFLSQLTMHFAWKECPQLIVKKKSEERFSWQILQADNSDIKKIFQNFGGRKKFFFR